MLSLHIHGFLVETAVLIILGWSIYLPLRAGRMYNGSVFCMAISAYFVAFTTDHFGWPVPVASFLAVCSSTLVAGLLSPTLANVSGFAMAVATIALTFIVQTILRNLDFLGGAAGYSFYVEMSYLLPAAYTSVLIIMIIYHRISRSRMGRAMELMDRDIELADAMGIDTKKMSMLLQTISGTLGGLAGVFFAFNNGTLFPEMFGFNFLLYGFTIVMVGGRTTLWGTLVFAPVLWAIPEFAPDWIGQWRNIMFGSIICVILLWRPQGVITKNMLMFQNRIIGVNSQKRSIIDEA